MAKNLYSYYIHFLRKDYMNRRIAALKLTVQQHDNLTLQAAIQEQRDYLKNSVKAAITLSEKNKNLYKQLGEIYTYLQYNYNKSEALNAYGIDDDTAETIRNEFMTYLAEQPYVMNIPDLSKGEKIDLGHATKLFLDKNSKSSNTIYYSKLKFYKQKIETLIRNLSMHTNNIGVIQEYVAELNALSAKLDNLIGSLSINEQNNKQALLSKDDKNILNHILNTYSQIAKKVSGVSTNWGDAAELFYAFGFATIGQNMIIDETKKLLKDLVGQGKQGKSVQWTGSQKTKPYSMLQLSGIMFDYDQIEKDMNDQNTNFNSVGTNISIKPNKSVVIDIKSDSKATADFIGTINGEDVGISVKNYTAQFGGKYGITVLSGTNFLNLFSEFNVHLQGHAANLMSVLHKCFPSNKNPNPQEASHLKSYREDLRKITILTGAIRGLTGVKQGMLKSSIKESYAAQILIVNAVEQKKVYVFNTADIVDALLSLNHKGIATYIEDKGYPTSYYPNEYEGEIGNKNFNDAIIRSSKFFGWARKQNGIEFHLKRSLMQRIMSKYY